MRIEENNEPSRLRNFLVIIGGCGLIFAMMTDTIAVIGRHIGLPLLGSIELFRTFACLAAISSLAIATLADTHASVNFLTDRLSKPLADGLDKFSSSIASMICLAIAIGLAWSLKDQIGGYEQSEVLGIPYFPLRAYCVFGLLLSATVFLFRAFKGRGS